MEWVDQGIVLSARRHGESDVVLDLMTHARGRHLGLVRGGRSRRLRPLLQPGNRLQATWRARLDDHLGQYVVEPLSMRAARLFDDPALLFALQVLTGHLGLLAEREAHAGLYAAVDQALDAFSGADPPTLIALCAFVARFELALLEELGFGLDLERCARTGVREDLAFVSPRSGRAVSRAGAVGYEDRLLPLARFLIGQHGGNDDISEIRDAFRLTGHFLDRDVYGARSSTEPMARRELLSLVERVAVARTA